MAKRKIKLALEGGGIGRSYDFPSWSLLPNIGMATQVRDTAHLYHPTPRELYDMAGRAMRRIENWLGPDQVCRAPAKTADEVMAKADAVMAAHDETLRLRFGDLSPSHMVGLDFRGEDGLHHRINDSRGRPAFEGVFDSEFWSTPVAAQDLTLRDVNLILPEELREANFGTPTVKPPGVV